MNCKYCSREIPFPSQICDECWRNAMKGNFVGISPFEELEK